MNSNFGDLLPDIQPLGLVSDFISEFIEAVGPQHFLDGFSRQETAMLSEYLDCFGVPRESTVLREGDESDFLAILITGKAIIYKLHDGDNEQVQEISPGEIIGVMSFLDREKRFASCITAEPCDFAVLTRDSLNAMLADHPRLGNKFLLMLLGLTASRLRQATRFMLPGHIAMQAE